MRSKQALSLLVVAVTLALLAPSSRAEEPAPAPEDLGPARPISEFPWFVSIGAGVGYASVVHPQIVQGAIATPTFTLLAGYTFRERFTLGFDWSAVEAQLGRDTLGEQFRLGYSPQAGCTGCKPKVPGGDIGATSLVMNTVGARFEYAPLGRDGLFLGATAGLAFMVGLESQSGFGAAGRVGYRFRPSNIIALSVEGGVQAQLYDDTQMYMPFGALSLRPYF